ncbi:ribonuclease H-like domain-containing protein [Tanacetum coccineum]
MAHRANRHNPLMNPLKLTAWSLDPHWCNAMYDEYNALVKNSTWILVLRPSGDLARLVANDRSHQQLGVDFDETFSPVVKPATICTVVSLVVSRKRPIRQLDVKNAFFNASSPALLQQSIDSLHSEFDMTDLGELNYFLGISVVRHPTGLFLS